MDHRLKSKIIIDKLFVHGQSHFVYPIKMMYMTVDGYDAFSGVQYGVSVSRRTFKKSVDRNKIKRRLREAIRLNDQNLLDFSSAQKDYTAIMFIFVGKELLEYKVIDRAVKKLLKKLQLPY
ncbi:MAG: ribonuclease P protein component [Saprospiraceae bacterium]|nr:ribonuclease P protein component [Saprospiraceae bacterium]